MTKFKEIRERTKTADKKPEKYTDENGKVRIRMVPVDQDVAKDKVEERIDFAKMRKVTAARNKQGLEDPFNMKGLKAFAKKAAAKATGADQWHKLMRAKYGKSTWDSYWKKNRGNDFFDKILDFGFAESTELEEISKKKLTDYAKKASTDVDKQMKKGKYKKVKQRVDGMHLARRKTANVAEETEIDEDITKISHGRLKYHATKKFPHGRYTRKEIDNEHKRRMKVEPDYPNSKASLNELSTKKLKSYRDKATDDIHKPKHKKRGNRLHGIELANDKITAKESVEIHEVKSMDGDTLKVGDFVGFKDGVEQSGKITKFRGNTVYISVWDSVRGERYEVAQNARRVWKESVEEGVRFKTAYGSAGGSRTPTKREEAARRKRAEERRKRLAKEFPDNPHFKKKTNYSEETQLDELSKKTLSSYMKKAPKSADKHLDAYTKGMDKLKHEFDDPPKKVKDHGRKGVNREDGIERAKKKMERK